MTDTVDLIVVGVEEDIPRAEMSRRLVDAFKQEAFTFESLLDGAYGESAPYAAQTGVEQSLAQGGLEQLELLGLKCTILPTGEKPEPIAVAPVVAPAAPLAEQPVLSAGDLAESLENDSNDADGALASFKSDDEAETEAVSSSDEVSFDLGDDLESGDSALASFKRDSKSTKGSASEPVDFSDDLDSVGTEESSVGLADAKRAKNDAVEIDDSLNHDFSDQIEDVGADKLANGLKEAQKVKPNFGAEVSEVDFSADAESIGIHEKDSTTPEVSKSKLKEEISERNLASFPKEDVDQESVDFSDELEILSSDEPLATATEGAKNKADVPEALADVAGDDLEADLIDPAPVEKEHKEPVEIDDGGLSLSADNDSPLTTPKEKSNIEPSDDGGLSLSEDQSAPLTAPKKKADPDAADDGDLELSADAEANADSSTAASDASLDASTDVSDADAEVPEPAVAAEPTPAEQPAVVPQPAAPEPATSEVEQTPATPKPVEAKDSSATKKTGAASGGLVLPGQLSRSVAPNIVSEDDLDDSSAVATASLRAAMPEQGFENIDDEVAQSGAAEVVDEAIDNARNEAVEVKSKKKLVAAVAGIAVLAGAGTFAYMNAGSIAPLSANLRGGADEITQVKDATHVMEKMHVEVAELKPGADLESLSTGELLVNLSNNESNGIVDLEPYFLESGDQVRKGPRLGAAIPAESQQMMKNRQSHPADTYFDSWSNRDADLSLFLALLDNLIVKGDLEVAQQLSDRAKDKLFSVMSAQRLARGYSDAGEQDKVSRLMTLASRNTYSISAPEERVLALSDYAFTEQAIGLNEGAMDTFLKTSILARSLVRPERRVVGLSSASMYFHRSGRVDQAQGLLEQALQAGNELPENTAAKDLAVRYIALSEGRMGLFNQALEHAKLIVDPIATVSAYHGIALAIESSGDHTNARKVLNMAYRAGSQIEDPDERSNLLSKVVLASESE